MLPGGLWHQGQRWRSFRFHAVDGTMELALADIGRASTSTPEAVTAALCAALAELAGEPPSRERVRSLCVADRQFLMRELDMHFGRRGGWQSATCGACGESFDFHLDYEQLPVLDAKAGFPFVSLELSGSVWRFRLPNGEDQERLGEPDDALRLLQRCLLEPDASVEQLSAAQLEQVDAAMEDVSPGVVTEVQATCPHCDSRNQVGLNPYAVLGRRVEALLTEVHQIAIYYHWSEREILALPRQRRQTYLRLIDSARGMSQ